MDNYDLEELENIMVDGVATVECTECGYIANIEPDADYLCPECKKGRLISPLRKYGLI